MNTRDWIVAAVGCLGSVLSLHATPARAASPLPPPVMHFCSANCFTLILKDGQYVREDGTLETWTIERFTADSVILHRHDPPVAWNGFKTDVVYAGKAANDRLAGLTVAGDDAPTMALAWGAALGTVPGSNAERDNPALRRTANMARMQVGLPTNPGAVAALPAARASTASGVAPASLAPAPALPAGAAGSDGAISSIHVLTGGAGIGTTELLTYTPDGAPIAPHIVLGRQQSFAMTADAHDVLYISHNSLMDYVVAAYRPDGTLDPRFRPIPAFVEGLAVSPAGNLYVLERLAPPHAPTTYGVVKQYTPDGRPVGAPINTLVAGPTCLAVDAAGTIYVAGEDENVVETFDPSGQRLALTIKDGIKRPMAIAVDRAGKIYVVNAVSNTLTTYSHDGQRTTPTISSFDNIPTGVALDSAGRIYVGVGRRLGIYAPTGELIKYVAEIPVSIRSVAVH